MNRPLYPFLAVLALLGESAIALDPGESASAVDAVDGFPVIETRQLFIHRCERELLAHHPEAASWAPAQCRSRWQAARAAGPMAEALLTLAQSATQSFRSTNDVRNALSSVQWSSDREGTLGDLAVVLRGDSAPGISFAWYEIGAYGRYNVIDALRSRGATLQTLGCPQYPGASMGQEKVMRVDTENAAAFTISVYSRGAPTAIEPGIYEVNAQFGGAIPSHDALQSGNYPGGGGRAFAVDATGWIFECADPE
ncbi:MAG: hypothetical protein KDI31_06740 [Pseudomonadales bacterium]|nr:hypothetical protein [Pseudomonadales bacterium]